MAKSTDRAEGVRHLWQEQMQMRSGQCGEGAPEKNLLLCLPCRLIFMVKRAGAPCFQPPKGTRLRRFQGVHGGTVRVPCLPQSLLAYSKWPCLLSFALQSRPDLRAG